VGVVVMVVADVDDGGSAWSATESADPVLTI